MCARARASVSLSLSLSLSLCMYVCVCICVHDGSGVYLHIIEVNDTIERLDLTRRVG